MKLGTFYINQAFLLNYKLIVKYKEERYLKITISNNIKVLEIPGRLIEKIKQDLTMSNPEIVKKERLGFYTGDLPKHITMYEDNSRRAPYHYDFDDEDNVYLRDYSPKDITVPRGYYDKLEQRISELGMNIDNIEYQTTKLKSIHFDSSIELRDYQEKAVTELIKHDIGGLCSPCGSGKTVMMLEVINRVAQPALWICHTKELLKQTKERAIQFLGLSKNEIGIIENGKINLKPKLTIALVQTLSSCSDYEINEINNYFGCVVVDEAHHMAADSFYNCIMKLKAHYRYWATATPNREDGLTPMVLMGGGNIRSEVNRSCIPTITPTLKVIKTNFKSESDNYTEILNQLMINDKRNELIVKTIKEECEGNYSIVITERIGHAEQLKIMLQEELPEKRIYVLHGSLKAKDRSSIMEKAKNKEVDILICTKLAREGLDLTHLNRLFMVMPKSSTNSTIQEVGRIQRPCDGKTDAIVYDFWDSQQDFLQKQFWKRRKAYNEIGFGFRF